MEKHKFIYAILFILVSLVISGCCDEPSKQISNKTIPPKTNKSQETPQWLMNIPDQLQQWLRTVQYEPNKPNEPWGLFTFSTNSKIPYSIVATAIAWGDADYFGGIEKMPGYHPKARQQMAEFVQQFQDPNTGQFRDPWLESCFPDRDEPNKLHILREAITKYTMGLLSRCGTKLKYPYMAGGHKKGKFDPDKYISNIENGNWNQPWGTGSHTGFQTVQLFQLIEDGHSEYIPVLKQGIQLILSHQNPKTGMWGPKTIPLSQQIGGTLKVIGRFQWSMGLIVPNMDKLADSIIRHHRSGAFYAGGHCASVPRNVAEMAYACIEASDYRRDELRQVLIELVDILRDTYQQSDGSFCYMADGRTPKNWCGAVVADKSKKSYGDVHGVQNVIYAIYKTYNWLGWTGMSWEKETYWRDRIKKLNYKVFADKNGRVQVEPHKDN